MEHMKRWDCSPGCGARLYGLSDTTQVHDCAQSQCHVTVTFMHSGVVTRRETYEEREKRQCAKRDYFIEKYYGGVKTDAETPDLKSCARKYLVDIDFNDTEVRLASMLGQAKNVSGGESYFGTYMHQAIEEINKEATIMDRKQALQAQIDRAAQQLAELEKFGDDTFKNGAVIKFKYQFRDGGIWYSYAAIKVKGKWYTSGPQAAGQAFTWDDLISWFQRGKVKKAFLLIEDEVLFED